MDLEDMLYHKSMKRKTLIRILKSSNPTVHHWLKRTKTPNLLTAMKLFHMSKQMINFEELLSEPDRLEYRAFKKYYDENMDKLIKGE